MGFRACALFASLAFALPVAAETVYKYRGADGKMTYSNRLLPNAELIETFDYRFAPAAEPGVSARRASKAEAAVDERMKTHLAALDSAWNEVQLATRALAAAEARLAAGVAPLANEETALAGPPADALPPPPAGGPQAPVATAVGGAAPAASPAVGGPLGTRRGGGRNADYVERNAGLAADVVQARSRLDVALKAYNQLR